MGGMGQQGFNGVNQYGMMQQQTRVSNGQGNFGPVMNSGMMGPVMNNMATTGNNSGAGGNMMMNNGPVGGFQHNGMTKMSSMQQVKRNKQNESWLFEIRWDITNAVF